LVAIIGTATNLQYGEKLCKRFFNFFFEHGKQAEKKALAGVFAASKYAGDEVTGRLGRHFLRRARQRNRDAD
jgi:hypothetical protein